MSSTTTTPKESTPSSSSTVLYTPSGGPYLTLTTGSKTPIYLTPFYRTDVPALCDTHTREEVSSVLIMPPNPYHLSDAEFWIDLMLSDPAPPTNPLRLQAIRANFPDERGTFIGSASMSPDDSMEKEYELGYYLHPDWRGMGIMGAASKALVAWAKEVHGANAVVRVEESNAKSRKVVEGIKEWVRVPERDAWRDWPERLGGGQRWILFWKWVY